MLIYTLKVEQLINETNDTVTVCFKQPTLKKVKYFAGQYLTLIFYINGRRYARPYSFSSSPNVDPYLCVTVKRVQGGVVSNHICDKVKVGDMVQVIEPMGDFTLKNTSNVEGKHIVLWGSGSGITPLMSIIKYALHNVSADHVTLVYGNKKFETTIFSNQIKTLQQQFPDTFSVWYFYTEAVVNTEESNIIQGRIDPNKIASVIKQEGTLYNTIHYICGPLGLKDSVKEKLNEMNVPTENIFSEDFEVVRSPKDFENIFTQNVSINVNDQTSVFEVTKGKSILEAGLDTMIDLPYSCQTGNCLLCKAKVIKGEIKMIGVKLPSKLNSDECLLCCSFPLTSGVEIIV